VVLRKTELLQCNGARPSCNICIQFGFVCTYELPHKDGSASTPAESAASHEERIKKLESTIRVLAEQQIGAGVAQSTTNERRTVDFDDHGSTEEETDCAVDGMAAISDPEQVQPQTFGPSSNISLLREIITSTKCLLGSTDVDATARSGRVGLFSLVSPRKDQNNRASTFSPAVNEYDLPPRQIALSLLDLFSTETSMKYPFVDEKRVRETYHIATNSNNARGINQVHLALLNILWAMIARSAKSPLFRTAKEALSDGEKYYQRAHALWLSSCRSRLSASPELVQLLLCMVMYCWSSMRQEEAWHLHGLALRSAFQLGLYTKSADGDFDGKNQLHRRIWFGCVIIDRLVHLIDCSRIALTVAEFCVWCTGGQ
jgi:hypothetical protein